MAVNAGRSQAVPRKALHALYDHLWRGHALREGLKGGLDPTRRREAEMG